MSWFAKTAGPLDMPLPSMDDKKPPFGGKPSAPKPPFGGPSEKKDVLDGKGIAKAIKDLIAKEKSEPEDESKDIKLLEQALEKIEKFVGAEKKEVKKDREEKKEEPKEDKEASY